MIATPSAPSPAVRAARSSGSHRALTGLSFAGMLGLSSLSGVLAGCGSSGDEDTDAQALLPFGSAGPSSPNMSGSAGATGVTGSVPTTPEAMMPGGPLVPGPATPNMPPPQVTNPMQAAPTTPAAPTPTCTAGQVTCDGANTIATCSADGLDVSITRCADGTVCSGAGVCSPVTCNAQGLTSFNGGQATVYWFGQGTINFGDIACGFGIQPGNLGNGQGDSVTGIPDPQLFVAINTSNYRGSASCGACVEMSYQGRNVTATVVDECPIGSNPTCTPGHLDLSRGAWNALTNNAPGTEISGVNWRFVPCNTAENVTIELKEPNNQYWNQFLVRNHRFPVAKAEVELANGTWVEAARTNYNFFEPPEGIMGTYRVRVTDVNGGVIEEQLELAPGAQGGNSQFACQ